MPSVPPARVTSMIELSTVAGASCSASVAVAAGLEADGVDAAVDLGHAEDLLDLVLRVALGDVDRLAAEDARLLEPLRVQVADDDRPPRRAAARSARRRGRPGRRRRRRRSSPASTPAVYAPW